MKARTNLRDALNLVLALLLLAGAATAATTVTAGEEDGPTLAEQLKNGRQLEDGTLVGGQPTAAWLEEASAEGYSTVIDLRGVDEDRGFDEAAATGGQDQRYVPLPIASADELTEELARRFDAALQQADGGVVVHCASGNRVGALYALRAHYVQGLEAEAALEVGREAGLTSLESKVAVILGIEVE